MNIYCQLYQISKRFGIRCSIPFFIFAAAQTVFSSGSENLSTSNRVTPVVKAVSKVLESVVNISTERIVTKRYQRFGYSDPFTKLFEQFFGLQDRNYKTNSLGSGVIVDRRGLILTNNHVIQKASRIIITLADGSDYDAVPVATDQENDLALIRLEGLSEDVNLHAIPFAKPNDLYLGETVIAVGNPFGLGHSVATGVLSAIKRKVIYDGEELFDDIMQTDAAINPGNSGGPVINVDGELIGINLAIHGDAEGIGFAIPLKRIEDILSFWMIPSRFSMSSCGIIPGTITTADNKSNVFVSKILPDSPLEQTSIKENDIIQSINGIEVHQAIDASRILWSMKNGDSIKFVLENGKTEECVISSIPELGGKDLAMKTLNAELQQLTKRLGEALGLPYSRGLIVSDLDQNSSLAKQGVQRGDVIIQIGEIPIAGFSDLVRALNQSRYERVLDFVVDRVVNVRGHLILHRYILNVPI